MGKRIQRVLSFLLLGGLLLGLCACGAAEEAVSETETETTPLPAATEEAVPQTDERSQSEKDVLSGLDYSRENFITEEVFYATLMELLALHDLELTRYPGDGAYYFCNYGNVENVKLLTVGKPWEQIEIDRAQAQEDYEARLAGEEAAERAEKTATFYAAKDVEHSQDCVVSFVVSASRAETDQQLLFLISSAAWAILNPKYDSIEDSFDYLWSALFNNYNHGGGLSASTIDGIDNTQSFTIPGNAVEAWIGTDENDNFIVAITLYAEYDEVIEVNSASSELPGMAF